MDDRNWPHLGSSVVSIYSSSDPREEKPREDAHFTNGGKKELRRKRKGSDSHSMRSVYHLKGKEKTGGSDDELGDQLEVCDTVYHYDASRLANSWEESYWL